MKIAKADLVQTDRDLRDEYQDFAELEAAWSSSWRRRHALAPGHASVTDRDAGRGAEHLHRLLRLPHTIVRADALGQLAVDDLSGGAVYSVRRAVGRAGWVRIDGSELIVVHVDGSQVPGGRPA